MLFRVFVFAYRRDGNIKTVQEAIVDEQGKEDGSLLRHMQHRENTGAGCAVF